jgi:hypothetical protein
MDDDDEEEMTRRWGGDENPEDRHARVLDDSRYVVPTYVAEHFHSCNYQRRRRIPTLQREAIICLWYSLEFEGLGNHCSVCSYSQEDAEMIRTAHSPSGTSQTKR